MEKFELELFQLGHPFLNHITLWRRYVDNIFCVWQGPKEFTPQVVIFMNNLYPSIEFTVKIGGSSIDFLDLTISVEANKFIYNIYWKPTATDITIHASSFSPPHKLTTYHFSSIE